MDHRRNDEATFIPWLAQWLEQRAKSRPESGAMDEATWPELSVMLEPNELGVFFTLVQLAAGRKEFEMHPEQLLRFFSMPRARFDEITLRLVERGLIETLPAGTDSVLWRIIRRPAEP